MDKEKKQRKLDEFCSEGNLEHYREELRVIFDMIELGGCNISSRTDEHSSQHSFSKEGCMIRVSLKSCYDDPLDIIWTILHEYGHHLSGMSAVGRLSREHKLDRERKAWDHAEKLLPQFPRLFQNKEAFNHYREQCLNTYNEGYMR